MEQNKVRSDAYFLITVKWIGGFTHKVPCRGYGLKSQIDFTKSLDWVEEFNWEECDQAEYDRRVFGIGEEEECQSSVVVDTKSKVSTKRTASQSKRGTDSSRKQSAMSASVKPASKDTSVKKKSSTTKKKN